MKHTICNCRDDEGRACAACTELSRRVLHDVLGWILLVLLAALVFAATTFGRVALPRSVVGYAFVAGVIVLSVAALVAWAVRLDKRPDPADDQAQPPTMAPPPAPTPAAPARRVRAGGPPPMRPSYDGRRKNPTA